MGLITWIIFGAIVGWLASAIMKTDKSYGVAADIVIGIVGAVIGGLVMGLFGQPGVGGFDLYSLIVAVIGAVILIYIARLI